MVYVDDMNAPYGKMLMCHMLADTQEELLSMATNIGINVKWIQHKDTHKEHFDICLAKKKLALKLGAKLITWKEAAKIMSGKRTKLLNILELERKI